jgi:hypothetical protein
MPVGLATIKDEFMFAIKSNEGQTDRVASQRQKEYMDRENWHSQKANTQRYVTPVSRRFTVTERDQKDRRVFAYVCMYV